MIIQQNAVGKEQFRALFVTLQMEITQAATELFVTGQQRMQFVRITQKVERLGAFQRLLKCLIGELTQKAKEIMV